jgi:hypothetical protein
MAASLTNELRLQVRKPDVIGPFVDIGGRKLALMAAPEVAAIDQQTAHARSAHFTDSDFLGAAQRNKIQHSS